jgi:hypothetical protein
VVPSVQSTVNKTVSVKSWLHFHIEPLWRGCEHPVGDSRVLNEELEKRVDFGWIDDFGYRTVIIIILITTPRSCSLLLNTSRTAR